MKIYLFPLFFLALASCSSENARQNSMKEALSQSQNCHALPTHGLRARCIGSRMLQADQRNGINPKYDVQKIDAMTQIEDAVDHGQISEQDGNQRLSLAFSAIDAQAKSDDTTRSRAMWGNALMGMSAGMASFNNGYSHPSYVAPAYRSPTTCMTQPSGGGFVTSCNH